MNQPQELSCTLTVALPSATVAPEWIMYCPGGAARSFPAVNGKPAGEITITSDAATAAALQRDLMAFKAEGGPQPFFDFDHDGRGRSARPLEFAWRDGDKPGVYVRVRWTPRGEASVIRAAHQAADYEFFSPRCAFDSETGRITGLLPRARGLAAGGLVNDPAFETISPLTAAKAAAQAAQPNTDNNMDPTKLAALVAAGLLTADEAKKDNAIELAAAKGKELKDKLEIAAKAAPLKPDESAGKVEELTASLGKVEKELTAMKGKLADKFVSELVASGKIPPQAEATRKMWRANYLADEAAAEAAAKELVASRALNPNALTDDADAGSDAPGKVDAERVRAKAEELMASKAHATWDGAWNAALQLCKPAA